MEYLLLLLFLGALFLLTRKIILFFLTARKKGVIGDCYDYWGGALKYVVALVLLLFGGVRVFQVLISPKEAAVYSFSWEPVAFFSLFIVFSIIASGYIKRTVNFLKGSIRSVGVISGFLEVKDIDNQVGYKPIVTYKDMDGQEHKFHSSVLKDNKKEIGREVPIRYKMQEPSAAEVDSFLAIWAIPIFFVLVAFLSLVFSFIS